MLAAMEAAFFDLDKTVIAKASMVAFGRPLLDAGMISRWLMVRALWSHLIFELFGADEERMKKFRESALRITVGWDQARISALVRETLVEVIEPIVYDEALELIRRHQSFGRKVFIVSASPEEIVAPLAQYLGVDDAIATRARLDASGRYTGDVEFYSYGPFKADAIREVAERDGIELAGSYAYSDSATDVPMLEAVGHPVAVNPDRELARIARERAWEVQTFSHEVPLRSRVSMPRPRRIAIAITTVVIMSAVGTTAWWWRARLRQQQTAGATKPASERVSLGRAMQLKARPAQVMNRRPTPGRTLSIRRRLAASSRRKQQERARR
ncbi:MAG: HAD-IB family hydrolase [Actinobacteria bacterium]|nr:HAD-IB family hydrolase [Actinomycetota bacterium]